MARNHLRLSVLQELEPGFAFATDATNRYRRLAYRVDRVEQECQPFRSDFELIKCVDRNDAVIEREDGAEGERELSYVAQPLPPVLE